MNDNLLNITQLAERVGVSRRTVQRWVWLPSFPAPDGVVAPRGCKPVNAWNLSTVRGWLEDRDAWDYAMDQALRNRQNGLRINA